jgi:DNA-3-methyladenine glycosylase II
MLKRLKEIRGVGDWTANYVLMKSLGRTDCITYGDTGLQSAVSSILELDRKPTREEIIRFFEPFAGWESYLNIYLWRTLS